MSRICHFFVLSFALLCALSGGTAHAVQRTHVSAAFGADANTASNCSATAPCRFFQAAMTVTDANGEVVVLDSGGYGAVTITQSVSLIAPTGVYAGISVFPGATGVMIATPGINVVLRGIAINGQGGSFGIQMTNGAKLTVENCVIANLMGVGINVDTAAIVRITDTTIRDNGNGLYLQNGARGTVTRASISGNAGSGILVYALLSGLTTADIADSTIDGNNYGVAVNSQAANAELQVSVRDSRLIRTIQSAALAHSQDTGTVTLSLSNNIISNNSKGMEARYAGSKIWASGNTVSANNVAFANTLALLESAGNNAVRNNGLDGTATVIATK